jgi:aspartate/methionine/tyrosine aminotransferase
MQLKPFLLDLWLVAHEHATEYNLASSTGPVWTLDQLLQLGTDEDREKFLHHRFSYGRPAGDDRLRAAIAEMQGVSADCIQVITGASEALLILMWLAAEPGANVVLPHPGYPPFSVLAESLGLETRFYHLRKENNLKIDLEEIRKRADDRTKLIVVNSPHNPTGATLSDEEWDSLHEFAAGRDIQLVSDEVYHPVYHGRETRSAARLPQVTVMHDFSKAYPLPGLRLGWMVEHDAERRERYVNARTYFSISNNSSGELLATIAMRNREAILERTRKAASGNLQLLDQFMAEHRDMLGWVRPTGGLTAFPWLLSEENARPFCEALTARGVLVAPGDCFEVPAHFRLGFAAAEDRFAKALERFAEFLKTWSVKPALAG